MLVGKYLINLAKRVAMDGPVHPAEIVNAPRLIDKWGNGDGVVSFDDIPDIASDIGETIVDGVTAVVDFLSNIL